MRVAILHNAVAPHAAPDEQDVLVQVAAVAQALRDLGHEAGAFGCDLDLGSVASYLDRERPDVVFNLVESLGGHGRLIHLVPDLLEARRQRYAGCPAAAIYLTSHKLLAKQRLRDAGLPTPQWFTASDVDPGVDDADTRWIVKSLWEDASLGMDDTAVVAGTGAARALLAARADRPGAPWFAERYIEGREFNLSLLAGPHGVEVLPIAEIVFADFPAQKPRIVGYAAKWDEGSFEYTHTVRRFPEDPAEMPLMARLSDLARACWRLWGLRGWARVDLRVDADGNPWILEANANACLSPDAGYAAAAARAGLAYREIIARIVAHAASGHGLT